VNAQGIDVSEYQGTTPGLAGLDFLIARASVGTTRDLRYAQHVLKAVASGLVTGAYHFADARVPIGAQVTTFLDAAGDVDLYFVDVEGRYALSVAQTRDFIAGVHAAGKPCGLYHSDSGYYDAGQDYRWVAKWSATPPTHEWDFWQHRGSPLDLDTFNGTRAQLDALVLPIAPDTSTGGPPMLPVTKPDDPQLVTTNHPCPFYDLSGVSDGGSHGGLVDYFSPLEMANGTSHFRLVSLGPAPDHLALVKAVGLKPVAQDCAAQIAADRLKARIVYE
jgi:hypothetical protein